MSRLPIASIDRGDVAQFVDSLFLVFIVLIFARIAINWVVMVRGSIPYNAPLRAVTGFIEESVDPYLNLFRRFVPQVNLGGLGLDLGPMVGILLLIILEPIVVGLIDG